MWGFLVFLVGLLYGWLTPGKQDKGRIFRDGLLIGAVMALVLALLGAAIHAAPLPLGAGVLGVILGVVALTLIFILGTWLGDLVERSRGRQRHRDA